LFLPILLIGVTSRISNVGKTKRDEVQPVQVSVTPSSVQKAMSSWLRKDRSDVHFREHGTNLTNASVKFVKFL